jgi:hypothetical protein
MMNEDEEKISRVVNSCPGIRDALIILCILVLAALFIARVIVGLNK